MVDADSSADRAQDAEFDVVAEWTADAITELGPGHALPGACRGTGGTGALTWLVDALDLEPGAALLDVGGGLGGPAAVVRQQLGVSPLLVDLEPRACRAARRLFGVPAVLAAGQRLPFPAAAVPAVWSLGVLCTVEDQDALVAELARVLEPDGQLGLMVLVSTGTSALHASTGNLFPTVEMLGALLARHGFAVTDRAWGDVAPSDPDWDERAQRVEDLVRRRHGHHPAHQVAQDQEAVLADLLERDTVRRHLVSARRRRA